MIGNNVFLINCFKIGARSVTEHYPNSVAIDSALQANLRNTSMLYVAFLAPLRELIPSFRSIWGICPRKRFARLRARPASVFPKQRG